MRDNIIKTLASIYRNADGLKLSVHVVDNASEDGSIEAIRKNFPETALLVNSINRGFGAAHNQNLKKIDADYILVLNPDVEILPGTLSSMLNFMKNHPDAGVVGCKILNPDGTIQYSCRRYPSPSVIFCRGLLLDSFLPETINHYLMKDWDHKQTIPVDWLTGCCLMLRKKTLDKIGLFDEKFFLYFEDVDLCARINKNWKVYYLHSASMIHDYQHESRKIGNWRLKWYHMISCLIYFNKHRWRIKN